MSYQNYDRGYPGQGANWVGLIICIGLILSLAYALYLVFQIMFGYLYNIHV